MRRVRSAAPRGPRTAHPAGRGPPAAPAGRIRPGLAPRLMVEVVLPTPPFWLHIAMTLAGRARLRGSGSGMVAGRAAGQAESRGRLVVAHAADRRRSGSPASMANIASKSALGDDRLVLQTRGQLANRGGRPDRLATMSLKARVPFLRWSFMRLALGCPQHHHHRSGRRRPGSGRRGLRGGPGPPRRSRRCRSPRSTSSPTSSPS